MVEKKRSIGVTIFGWWFIISGLISFLSVLVTPYFKSSGIMLFICGFLLHLAFFICGLFILKLRSWARLLVIAVCCVNVIYIIFSIPFAAAKSDELIKQREQIIFQTIKAGNMGTADQQRALEDARQVMSSNKEFFRLIFLSMIFISIGEQLVGIFFFTRPKVKEQFK